MSSKSLKALIPGLAKTVGMTPASLYERQRALVRAGLLQSESGKGPGSGVRATPASLAMLLIAILATGSLSETEDRTKKLAQLKSASKRCSVTGKKTFASALIAVLASEELVMRTISINALWFGTHLYANIAFEKEEDLPTISTFGNKEAWDEAHHELEFGLEVTADMWFPAIARNVLVKDKI